LKGQFHISTEELRVAVGAAEKETKEKAEKSGKKRARTYCTKLRLKKIWKMIFEKRLIAILRIVL
jgi:hypothetical protein